MSSAGELLGGRFGGMSVTGQDWCTPLQLSARTIEVSVGELQVDASSLLFQQRVALRNIPRGHCTLLLSASDLANFMTHQLMHQAAGRAVQGQAFLFDRNSVRFSAPDPTAGGPRTTTGSAATTQAAPAAAGTGQQAVAPVATLSSSNTFTHQLGGGQQGWVHYSGSFSGQQYHVSMQVGCDPLTASHRGPPWQGVSPLPSPRYGAARPTFSSGGPPGRAPLPPPQRVVVLARRSRPGHTQQQQQQQQPPGGGGAGQAPPGSVGRRGWPSIPPARQPAYAAGVPVAAVGVTSAAPTAPAGKAAMASVASAGVGGDPVGAWILAGDGVEEVVSQGLSQFFTGLRLNMQGVELSSPRMRLLLPPLARQPPGLGQGPGAGALLEISMDLRLLELPPLNMSF